MFLLIVPFFLDLTVFLIGVGALAALSWILYRLIIGPSLQVLAERRGLPPEDGTSIDILLDHNRRTEVISIGQLDSRIKTRMMGIKEDHLVIKFKKEQDLEEYEITVVPGGPVHYRPPHGAKLEAIKGSETFESSELIGHPATFRLAAFVQHNRLLQFIEVELSCSFVINSVGEEKMKFTLTITRIFPSVDRKKPPRKGVYFFGRLQTEESGDMDEE